MKTIAKVPYELVVIPEEQYLPKPLEPNKFYYIPWLRGSSHLCPCGCGDEVYLPIKNTEWQLEINGDKFTLMPSVLKRLGCESHYVITKNVANII